MCGIAGYVDFSKRTPDYTIRKMVDAIAYRGPDDSGIEHISEGNCIIGFGQARLSIIDLSSAGHQPMKYKQLTIVFNGEIYNYREIRTELQKFGHLFISDSDTEVVLHAYDQWGDDFVHRLNGMFVIAINDSIKQKLLIFRDRAGIKPVYCHWKNDLFLFASELKSLFAHPDFLKRIDINALALYFDFGYIPAPYSIFEETFKIEAGKYLVLDLKNKTLNNYTYWDIDEYYQNEKFNYSYDYAIDQLTELLHSAFNYRMVADVPVGIFLSGGYDSSIVTALLQKDRTEKLKTFTIGFEEGNNEAPMARKVAQYLGTDHTEYICTTREAKNIIPDLPFFYDEPFADSSAIPTILVSRVARESVKVALSADAGDELFGGYDSYVKIQKANNLLNYVPHELYFLIKPLLLLSSSVTPVNKSELKHKLKSAGLALNSDKARQAVELGRLSSSLAEFYKKDFFSTSFKNLKTKYDKNFDLFADILDIAMAIDYNMYLQNDILTKVDRATMSVSLEGREPLIDYRLAEFAAQLPVDFKFYRGNRKRILKDITHKYLPKELVDRPKAGFSLPIYAWLADDLDYLLEDYLNRDGIKESGLFNTDFVLKQVELFCSGKFYYKPLIWKLLMFQMWYFRWMK